MGIVDSGKSKPSGWAYLALFLIAWATLTLELLCTRIVSAMAFYHLAFFVVSLAILGMTAGALLVYCFPDRFSPETALPRYANYFALSLPLAVAGLLVVPLREVPSLSSAFALVANGAILGVPFLLSGILISLTLTRCGLPYGRIYAADLLGAALGAELILPGLTYLKPGAIVFLLAGLILVAAYAYRRHYGAGRLSSLAPWLAALGVLAFVDVVTDRGLAVLYLKGQAVHPENLAFQGWTTHAFVTLSKPAVERVALPGAAALPATDAELAHLLIDGSAATDLTRFDGDLSKVNWLHYSVTALAYQLQRPGRVAIIGIGGGGDALSALTAGADHVTGIDVNRLVIELLEGKREPWVRPFAGLADHPRVRLVHDDARSWLATSGERFDVIQMSLIDTWAASASGAYTLTENGLYTVEAWATFLERLNGRGLFTVSRWYRASGLDETNRCVSMATAVCNRLGLTPAADHIILAACGQLSTLVISKAALSGEARAQLKAVAEKNRFQVLLPAGLQPATERGNVLAKLAGCGSALELESACAALPLDASPVTDDRPYFFNQLRLSMLGQLDRFRDYGGELGNLKATWMLLAILTLTVAGLVIGIIGPLRHVGLPSDLPPGAFRAGVLYFAAIGLGYMLVEMAFVQRFAVLLGHPNYALAWVIASMVLATGTGSYLAAQLPVDNPRLYLIYPMVIVVVQMAAWALLPVVFPLVITQPLPVRILAVLAFTVPCGMIMGLGFPLGMVQLARVSAAVTPWMWGINGAASVVGTVLAVFLSMMLGISATLLAGVGCYVALLMANLSLRNAARQ